MSEVFDYTLYIYNTGKKKAVSVRKKGTSVSDISLSSIVETKEVQATGKEIQSIAMDFLHSVSPLSIKEYADSKRPSVTAGCVVRHFDDYKHGHIGIVLDIVDDTAHMIFLSMNPLWSTKYREASKQELNTIYNLAFGMVKKHKTTYLCKVERLIPIDDLTVIGSTLPEDMFKNICAEFLCEGNNNE